MSLIVTPLLNFRHVPTVIKTSWFKKEIVLILQQEYHICGEYYSPEPSGQYCPLHIDKKEWRNCKDINVKIEDYL